MRLTSKRGNYYDFDENDQIEEVSTKLGKLEDIEDELGVDLVTLFKALKNGIYAKKPLEPWKIIYFKNVDIFRNGIFVTKMVDLFHQKIEYGFSFDMFGKTWALTKKELL